MMTVEHVLILFLLKSGLTLLHLLHEVAGHLPLRLDIELLRQVFIDAILREAGQVRDLLLQLLTS